MLQDLQNDLQNLGISIPGAEESKKSNYMAALSVLDTLCQWRETEVELPLLGIKVLMKPIKGIQELRLKSLKSSGETFIKTFNQILFEHADFQGQVTFKSINDFMAHLGAADKQMMTYGLVFATYPALGEREFECPHCKHKQVHDVRPDELIHTDSITKKWEGPGIFTDFRDTVEIAPGFTIDIGFSTEQDALDIVALSNDEEMKQNISDKNEVFDSLQILIMFIKKINITANDGSIIELANLKTEIYPFIMNLQNLQLLEKLIDTLSNYDNLSNYQPKFYALKNCTNMECGKEFKWMVNPEIELFRKTSLFYNI